MKITVMQVFAKLNIEPTSRQAWAVGNLVAAEYAEVFGEQPPKDLRPKTSGAGSHCFALYPPGWEGNIERAIKAVTDEEGKQQGLFS